MKTSLIYLDNLRSFTREIDALEIKVVTVQRIDQTIHHSKGVAGDIDRPLIALHHSSNSESMYLTIQRNIDWLWNQIECIPEPLEITPENQGGLFKAISTHPMIDFVAEVNSRYL